MNDEPINAWQPLTFGGVARYAHDWVGKLFVTCLIISVLVAAAVVWTARRAWEPVVKEAIRRLPQGAELRGGKVRSPAAETLRLAESSFLSIQLGPMIASSADVKIALEPDWLRLRSLFGSTGFPYPAHWSANLNPGEMEAWWGAWRPAVFGYLAGGTIAFLFVSWIALGIVYGVLSRIIALFAKKRVSLWGCFKLGVAALCPGAIFMAIALTLYGESRLPMNAVIAAWVMHFAIGWVFLLGGTFRLPALKVANPFEVRVESESEPESQNPFHSRKGTGADPPPHE